jgi:uncharacterized membrane protein
MLTIRARRAKRPSALAAFATAATALLGASAAAQPIPMYQVTDLGSLAGPAGTSAAFGLNERGEVVGSSSAPNLSTASAGHRPFIWGPVPGGPLPVMRDLLPGISGTGLATDFNDTGLICGTFRRTNASGTRGFVHGGPLTVFPPVAWIEPLQGGNTTTASAINDAGVVAGSSNIAFGPLHPSATHAIRWHHGQTQSLGTLGGRNSEARGINTTGSIVGVSDIAATTTARPIRRGFNFPAGGAHMQALSALTPHGSSWANDISDFNAIVGGSEFLAPSTSPLYRTPLSRAVLWTPNSVSIINLGVLRNSDRSSEALAVNSAADVVGWSGNPASASIAPAPTPLPGGQGTRAFIWREHLMVDLNTRIPANSGWILHAATDINDHGQIVGWGTRISNSSPFAAARIHGFLLTPLPR